MIMYLVFFVATLAISALLMPLIIKVSNAHNLHDTVDKRKTHTGKISRLGGVAVFAAFFPFFLYICFSQKNIPYNKYLLIAATLVAFLTGFVDDLKRIPARYKLLFQIAAAVLVVSSGLTIGSMKVYAYLHIYFGILSYPITVVWIIAFMNAVNLIDGMDGLSTGLVLIANVFVFIISLQSGNVLVASLSAVLAGSILGFFFFNFPPAKIFLGDGGAYFIAL